MLFFRSLLISCLTIGPFVSAQTLTGRVLDDTTQKGIFGATVEITNGANSRKTLALIDGSFEFTNVQWRTVKLVCRAVNYIDYPTVVELAMLTPQVHRDIPLMLAKPDSEYLHTAAMRAVSDRQFSDRLAARAGLDPVVRGELMSQVQALAVTEEARANVSPLLVRDLLERRWELANYRLVGSQRVTFKFGKSKLTSEDEQQLDDAISSFSNTKGYVVVLNDTPGAGERRADAVEHYLVEHNVPAERIHVMGEAAGATGDTDATSAGRQEQHRVDILVYAPEHAHTPAGDNAGTATPATQK